MAFLPSIGDKVQWVFTKGIHTVSDLSRLAKENLIGVASGNRQYPHTYLSLDQLRDPKEAEAEKAAMKPKKKAAVSSALTPLQELVLSVLTETLSTSAVATLVNKPVAGTNSALQSLQNKGLVTSKFEGEWFWTKKA